MSIRSKHVGGNLKFYDSVTGNTMKVLAPLTFHDHFLGSYLNDYVIAEQTGAVWTPYEVANGVAPNLATGANGIVEFALAANDEAQSSLITWGDVLPLSMAQDLCMEVRARFTVLPTTGVTVANAFIGLGSAYNAAMDATVTNAWFRWDGTAICRYESDDATTDGAAALTGITNVLNQWYTFRIETWEGLATVRFFIDGVLVGTTSMAALALPLVQPIIGLAKVNPPAVSTGVATMQVDYVHIWQNLA